MRKINVIQFLPYFPPHKWGLETNVQEWWKWWVKKWYWKVFNIITDFDQDISLWNQIVFEWKIIWYEDSWLENFIVPSFEIISNFPVYKFWSKEYRTILKYVKTKNIELVISRTRFFLTSFIWWIYAKLNKINWMHIEHWSDYVKLNSSFKQNILQL